MSIRVMREKKPTSEQRDDGKRRYEGKRIEAVEGTDKEHRCDITSFRYANHLSSHLMV